MLRLLRADNPSVALDELPPAAAAAMVQRWYPSLTSDLILAEAASVPDCAQVEVVPDQKALRALLEECAAETECRMQRATEAAATQLAAAASVHEASALLLREAQANGLSGRHACRLALEAVLSCHALPLTLAMLALSLCLSLSLRLSLRRALALVPTLTLSRC